MPRGSPHTHILGLHAQNYQDIGEKKVPLTIILLFERNITRRYSIEDNNQTLLMRVVRLIAKKTKARIFSVFMD